LNVWVFYDEHRIIQIYETVAKRQRIDTRRENKDEDEEVA
jgi:hypothetical protein